MKTHQLDRPTLRSGFGLIALTMAAAKKKPLTVFDNQRQARLLKAWDAAVASGIASRKRLALDWGVTPSNVSQYLHGHIPINVEAQLQFARHLRKSPTEIWPDFEFADLIGDPSESLQLLDEADRLTVRALIASLQRRRA
jgi:hypothetical protein